MQTPSYDPVSTWIPGNGGGLKFSKSSLICFTHFASHPRHNQLLQQRVSFEPRAPKTRMQLSLDSSTCLIWTVRLEMLVEYRRCFYIWTGRESGPAEEGLANTHAIFHYGPLCYVYVGFGSRNSQAAGKSSPRANMVIPLMGSTIHR